MGLFKKKDKNGYIDIKIQDLIGMSQMARDA